MDDRSFDRLARLLGGAGDRRTGLRALAGAILAAGGMATAGMDGDAGAKRGSRGQRKDGPAADRRRKRKKCTPACEAGFACVKSRCACASGVTCLGACCAGGQVCRDGACADPLPACLPFGEACKGVGRPCCAGLTCASGQDGSYPVACYRSKGSACASTAECPFGMACQGGACIGAGGGGVATGSPCAAGQTCDQPGATCTAYTTSAAPAGDFCTLPLRRACEGDPDCTCYHCWYVNGGAQGAGRAGRSGRASANVKACCHPPGQPCATESDCCNGLTCTAGFCSGTMCVPAGGSAADGACCQGLTIQNGVCTGSGPSCTIAGSNLPFDAECCQSSQCASGLCWYSQDSSGYPLTGAAATTKRCRVATGGTCSYAASGYYGQCGLGNYCDYSPTPNVCVTGPSGSYPLTVPTGGTGCDADHPCYDESGAYCSNGACVARTLKAIKEPCNPATDRCPDNASCQTYSSGVGSGATDTVTTYCLGNPISYKTTDPLACASLRTYAYGSGEGCTYKCKVYLDAGATDALRGAALKTALEAFTPANGSDWFFIEPDTVGAVDRKYLLAQPIGLTTPAGQSIVLCTCLGTGPAMPRPVLSGGGASRILDVTVAGDSGIYIQYLDFENGSATGDGGAIRIDSSARTGSREVSFSETSITGSTATGNGGGLYTNGPASVGAAISGCTAGGDGGGWYANTTGTHSAALTYGASVTGNTASGGSSQGAGVFWNGTATSSFTCAFNNNSSVAGNTDASTKFDCAYGTTSTTFTFCGCGYTET